MIKKPAEVDSHALVEERFPKKYLVFVIVVILVLASGYFFLKYQNAQKLLKNPAALAELEVSTLVKQVGKIIDLPSDESPTVATVSDKKKLAGQAFFKNAENGDKVLIYQQNKKAVLFRPSTGKIIEVSNIVLPVQAVAIPSLSPQASISPTSAPLITKTPTVTVAIYNGTSVAGLASTTEKDLGSSYPQLKVVKTGNAVQNYKQTVIVDVSGNHLDLVNKLVTSLSALKSSMPQSEVVPQTDIAIFLGK